jgi:hypothetical protein
LSDGREQLLDALLFGGWLDRAGPVGFSPLPQVALVRLLHRRKLPVDGNLDADFRQVREQFPPLRVDPDVEAPGSMGTPAQGSPHGVAEQRGHVVDRGPALDLGIGQQ